MVMVGSIVLILGAALAFTNYLIDTGAPQALFEFMQAHVTSALTFLLLLNLLLLVLGAVLDVFSAVIIMTPLLLPVAVGYGLHPIHLGIILLANLQIGYFTPPVGMNLFIASYRFERAGARAVRGLSALHGCAARRALDHHLRAVAFALVPLRGGN